MSILIAGSAGYRQSSRTKPDREGTRHVYKYATGVSAAIALADKVVNQGEPAQKAYLDFLKLGGSKFPLDALQDAGVDMRSPEPVKLAIEHFGQLVDQLIKAFKGL